jgi:phage-related protein
MRTPSSDFVAEKNKAKNEPIFLYKIYDYDGSNNLLLAEYDIDVTNPADREIYTRFPITHEFVSENTQGESSQVKIKIANVSRLIQTYLENYDFRGKKVDIYLVFFGLNDLTDYIKHTFFIDSYTADENVVEFTLSSKFDVLDVTLPSRKYLRTYCSWKFKDANCQYAGAETECNKTLQRCRTLANQINFGGFPSIPSQRLFAS